MRIYSLKSIAQRGMMLSAAFALVLSSVLSAVLPATSAFADALNPLTERSLTLSSGSPGWSYTDGSGNSTYAPPNSGANGNKTGNTFSFRVSSTAGVKGLTFQYCTTSAGYCKGPGNNSTSGTSPSLTRAANGSTEYNLKHSDLQVVTSSPGEVSNATFLSNFSTTSGQPSSAANVPAADNSEGNFIVMTKAPAGSWSQSEGWSMAASDVQTCAEGTGATCVGVGKATGKNNYITLTNGTGASLTAGDYVKIIFFGTNTNYITNPGADAFFVKINTYNDDATQDNTTLIDGGVTVANVMNRSIEIQTKVLETMDFSVGVVDPNTLDSTDTDGVTPGVQSELKTANGNDTHGICDSVLPGLASNTTTPNVLQMGNETGEFSLETAHTYSTHSYWRLSSNSSGGATVYYSGVTLSNTVGDQIDPINGGNGVAAAPTVGSEQFGLALANGTASTYAVSYAQERDPDYVYENGADNGKTSIHIASLTADGVLANASWHAPRLSPLVPAANYGDGTGNINSHYGTVDTSFAFKSDSNLIPEPIASESADVVDCVTGKVRYIANIAATTPAGIYTTKVNWIAAPQY